MLKPLPLKDWQSTKTALHLILQIIGKLRLGLHPEKNHWWHVTLYLNATGLTTGPIPYQDDVFEVAIDFNEHQVNINTQAGKQETIQLRNISVAEFYELFFEKLNTLNIKVRILDKPFDPERAGSDVPFSQNRKHQYTDLAHAKQFWEILAWIYPIFAEVNGQFTGKSTPIHLFWHSMDYVLTFFSGRDAPNTDGMDSVSKGAYSHEVISFGFWAGDNNLPEPAFYSYTYPEPKGLANQALQPDQAFWTEVNGGALAVLKYSDAIASKEPKKAVLDFLNSTYRAGASLAKWDTNLWND